MGVTPDLLCDNEEGWQTMLESFRARLTWPASPFAAVAVHMATHYADAPGERLELRYRLGAQDEGN